MYDEDFAPNAFDIPDDIESDDSEWEEENRKNDRGSKRNFVEMSPKFGKIFAQSLTSAEVELPMQYRLNIRWDYRGGKIEVLSKIEEGETCDYVYYTVTTTDADPNDNQIAEIDNHSLTVNRDIEDHLAVNAKKDQTATWIVLRQLIRMGIKKISTVEIVADSCIDMEGARQGLKHIDAEFDKVNLYLHDDEKYHKSTKKMYDMFLQKSAELKVHGNFKTKALFAPNNASRLRILIVDDDRNYSKHFKISEKTKWFKVDDILSLKHCEQFKVEGHLFTSCEINRILKAWQDGKLNLKRFVGYMSPRQDPEKTVQGLNAEKIEFVFPTTYVPRRGLPMDRRYKITRHDGTVGKLLIKRDGCGRVSFWIRR